MSIVRSSRIYDVLLGLLAFSLSMPTAVFNILFPLTLLYVLINLKRADYKSIFKDKLLIVLWISYLMLFLGLFYTKPENISEGLDLCIRRIFFIIAPLLFVGIDLRSYKVIAYGFIIGIITGFVICLITVMLTPGVYGSLSQIYISNWYWSELLLEPIDKHPSYFSFYSLLAFFMAFQLMSSTQVMLERIFTGFSMLIFFGIILTLEAKIFILIFPFMLFIFIFIKFKKTKLAIATMFLVAFTGFLFFMFHPARFHNIRLLSFDNAVLVRGEIYKSTWGIVKDNSIFGVGTGDFNKEILKSYRENNFTEGSKIEYNAHNQYLEEWARGGLLSFLCLAVILIVSFKRSDTRSPEQLILVICLCLFLTVESALNRQQGISFVLFFLCLYNSLSTKHKISSFRRIN